MGVALGMWNKAGGGGAPGKESCVEVYKDDVEVIKGEGKKVKGCKWSWPPRVEAELVPGIGDLRGDEVSTNKACTPEKCKKTRENVEAVRFHEKIGN